MAQTQQGAQEGVECTQGRLCAALDQLQDPRQLKPFLHLILVHAFELAMAQLAHCQLAKLGTGARLVLNGLTQQGGKPGTQERRLFIEQFEAQAQVAALEWPCDPVEFLLKRSTHRQQHLTRQGLAIARRLPQCSAKQREVLLGSIGCSHLGTRFLAC
jgi:hypothetical protein